MREKDLSLELLKANVLTIELTYHQAFRMKTSQQLDDSVNAWKKLNIKDTFEYKFNEIECLRSNKNGHLTNNKICKARSAIYNSSQANKNQC